MPLYPGLGFPLRYNPQEQYNFYPIGAHGSCFGSESFVLPVREVAMMDIMDKLTDKPDWNKKVFDEEIVSKWRNEALAIPNEVLWNMATAAKFQWLEENGQLTMREDSVHMEERALDVKIMNEYSFDFCIEELRTKAKHFEETGIIPTMDACASVAKSDVLVPTGLQEALRSAFNKLKQDHASSPDWHPRTNGMVQDLVHPSMYPLVYGRSRVLKDEVVGVADAIEKWAGRGTIIPKPQKGEPTYGNFDYGGIPPQYWSEVYQWLPSNVAIQDDGSVKFTSYINNLHPTKYPEIYRTIEELIKTALPMWDQCLALVVGYKRNTGAGRLRSRFREPAHPDDEEPENWNPSDPKEMAGKYELFEEDLQELESMYDGEESEEDRLQYLWEKHRKPVIPDPDVRIGDYAIAPRTSLAELYKDSGLQIIVKLASIELTPEKPDFPVGGWHVEGQMNEHICGTALFYLDSENVTDSSLSFRMQTSSYLNDDIEVGQDAYHWLEAVYGTNLGCGNSPCLQNYGTVDTKQGRLLAFPNVFQHRVSPFKLQDPTKPGHRRFIALWLVDPTKRIISTANVPPQQQTWWLESVFGSTEDAKKQTLSKFPAEIVSLLADKGLNAEGSTLGDSKLPPELMEMVRNHFDADGDALPMTPEEARDHREKLMQERSAFGKYSQDEWQHQTYNFCEH